MTCAALGMMGALLLLLPLEDMGWARVARTVLVIGRQPRHWLGQVSILMVRVVLLGLSRR